MLICRAACTGLVAVALLSGCGNPGSELAKPNEVITWPALTALQDPGIAMGIRMTAQMGDMPACRKNAADPKLEELVDKFAAEEIPRKFKTPAREAAKQKVVDVYKSLIAKAKGAGTDDELKSAVKDLAAAQTALVDPQLK